MGNFSTQKYQFCHAYLYQVLYTIDGAPGDDPDAPNAYVLTGALEDQVAESEAVRETFTNPQDAPSEIITDEEE